MTWILFSSAAMSQIVISNDHHFNVQHYTHPLVQTDIMLWAPKGRRLLPFWAAECLAPPHAIHLQPVPPFPAQKVKLGQTWNSTFSSFRNNIFLVCQNSLVLTKIHQKKFPKNHVSWCDAGGVQTERSLPVLARSWPGLWHSGQKTWQEAKWYFVKICKSLGNEINNLL